MHSRIFYIIYYRDYVNAGGDNVIIVKVDSSGTQQYVILAGDSNAIVADTSKELLCHWIYNIALWHMLLVYIVSTETRISASLQLTYSGTATSCAATSLVDWRIVQDTRRVIQQ